MTSPPPDPDAGPDAAARADRAWLAGCARAAGFPRTLCAAAGVVAGLLVVPQAGLLAWLVHGVAVAGAPLAELTLPLALLLAVVVLRSGCMACQEWAAAETACRVHRATRTRLYRHLVALGPAGIKGHATGGLTSAVVDQTAALGPYAARYQPQMLVTLAVPPAILATAFTLDWLAGLLLLLSAPLIPLFMALVGMGAEAVSRSQHQALARLGGHFLDRLQGLDLLRHLGRADAEADALAAVGEAYRRRTMAVLRVAFLSSAVLEFFSAVAIAMVAVYIGMGLLDYVTFGPAPDLTLFTGLFVLLLAPEFFQPLRQLAQHYHDRAAALGAAAELRALEALPSPMPASGQRAPGTRTPAIRLRDVTVTGDDATPLLDRIDLDVAPGEALLVTGASGSGKTTLLHVIAGFRAPARGALHIDGIPLQELDRAAWQQCLGWLAQQPHLFPGTLADNLAPGGSPVADATIDAALRRAGARALVDRQPRGLATELGEHGRGLSGGEGQRLALARALARQPGVLLVDEPTASLDPAAAEGISTALRDEAARGTTVIIVSHDDARFPWVDRVVTMVRGSVREARDA